MNVREAKAFAKKASRADLVAFYKETAYRLRCGGMSMTAHIALSRVSSALHREIIRRGHDFADCVRSNVPAGTLCTSCGKIHTGVQQ